MKKFIFIIFLNASIIGVYAQTDTSKSGTTVIYLGTERTKEPVNYKSSALKLGIFELASGMYGLYYEHELSSIFSVQGSVGLTGRNFVQGFMAGLGDQESQNSNNYYSNGSDIPDNYYDYDSRKAKIGYYIYIEPKFYYNEDGFDGSFVSFIFSMRRYNFEAMNVAPDANEIRYVNDNLINEFENQSILAIAFGNQSTNEKTVLEWNLAVGMRNISGDRRDLWYLPDANSALVPQAEINKVDKTQFYIGLSFKLGLFWN